ncbi:MAG: thiamine pyrophosphate-dependent dehydrogenase E1 component subunit alpha [Steroidobacteraceae bacterium]|jgi:pyruvate dehydrogenase E1 component alpha subunit|nr:thiamine pyrophosphate-dependent dehydrogenase E1 component subunit alpha [Steroidobacteraceae bacterium]
MSYDPVMLLEAYRRMRAIREFEERMRREVQMGTVPGFVHLYCGQEAVGVGACMNLRDTDYIGSTHRGHGHCISKGCDIGGMLLEIYCKQGGLCNGKGGSMHIADLRKGMLGANAIVGGAPPIAVGAALTHRTLGTDGVAMAFIGDGASNQGTVAEALNFSAVLKLPMIFLYENNGYAEFTGAGYHLGGADIAKRAASFGMPAEKVDGVDFFAVYDAVGRAVAHARAGKGPYAVEAFAYRWYGHFEGDMQKYRDPKEVDRLRAAQCPLARFESRATAEFDIDVSELREIDEEIQELIEEKVAAAKAAPKPPREALYTDVYGSY